MSDLPAGVDLAVNVTVGTLEIVPESGGISEIRGVLHDQWGIDSSGDPYFDPNGAVPAERALVALDATGSLVLYPRAGLLALARDTQGHLFTSRGRQRPERVYHRRSDGRLFEPAGRRGITRAYDRDSNARLFSSRAAGPLPRAYDRRPDGHLFDSPPPGIARIYDRDAHGRLFARRARNEAADHVNESLGTT